MTAWSLDKMPPGMKAKAQASLAKTPELTRRISEEEMDALARRVKEAREQPTLPFAGTMPPTKGKTRKGGKYGAIRCYWDDAAKQIIELSEDGPKPKPWHEVFDSKVECRIWLALVDRFGPKRVIREPSFPITQGAKIVRIMPDFMVLPKDPDGAPLFADAKGRVASEWVRKKAQFEQMYRWEIKILKSVEEARTVWPEA